MHVHSAPSFGQSDHVVSFDAFKVSRHGGDRSPRWEVHSLTPWAAAMLRESRVFGIAQSNGAIVLGSPDTGAMPPTQFQFGLGFTRRGDAIDFLRDIEKMTERWS